MTAEKSGISRLSDTTAGISGAEREREREREKEREEKNFNGNFCECDSNPLLLRHGEPARSIGGIELRWRACLPGEYREWNR